MQIGLLKDALRKAGLPLYLAPYGVLPTAYECGIIEVRPPHTAFQHAGFQRLAGPVEDVTWRPAEQECYFQTCVCSFEAWAEFYKQITACAGGAQLQLQGGARRDG